MRGVWAANATPFTPDDKIDEAGLRRNVRHMAGALRLAGILCAGTLGEFRALTHEHYVAVRKLCGERNVASHPSETDCRALVRDRGQRVHRSSAAPFLRQMDAWQPLRGSCGLALAGNFTEAQKVAHTMEPLREVREKWMREPWVKRQVIAIAELKAWSERLGLATRARRCCSLRPSRASCCVATSIASVARRAARACVGVRLHANARDSSHLRRKRPRLSPQGDDPALLRSPFSSENEPVHALR